MNNKFVKVGLAGLLAASLAACSNQAAQQTPSTAPEAGNSGVYEVKGTGYGGEMNLKSQSLIRRLRILSWLTAMKPMSLSIVLSR